MPDTNQENTAVRPLEKTFAVITLLFASGAFLGLFPPDRYVLYEQTTGEIGFQIAWAITYIITISLLLRRCKGFLLRLWQQRWLLILLAMVVLSTVWSAAPALTVRRSLALLGTSLFGVYFASRYTVREQLKLLAWMSCIVLVLSPLFSLLNIGTCTNTTFGVSQGWCGVFGHKNGLGECMALSMLVFVFLWKSDPRRSQLYMLGGISAFALLLLSNSKTSLLIIILMFSMVPIFSLLRKSIRRSVLILFGIVAAAICSLSWSADNLFLLMTALGRDVTLTGRLQIWILSAYMALQRPWLGYGYSAFWVGGSAAAEFVWRKSGGHASHAHNGYLEIWLDIGLIGLLLFLVGFCLAIWQSCKFLRGSALFDSYWPLVSLTFLFLDSLTEAPFLSRNNLTWIVYTASILAVSPAFHIGRNSPAARMQTVPSVP